MNEKQQAIIYMLTSCFFAACMFAIVRHLSESMHPFLVVFFRNAIALLLFLPWLYKVGISVLKTNKTASYAARAGFGLTAMFMWFYALSAVPLAQAIALSFTSPLFASIWAVLVLKEKASKARFICLVAGFIGTIIILDPGGDFSLLSILVLFAASLWSLSGVIIKTLTKTEKPEVITFYMVLMMTPLSIPAGIAYWQNPSISDWFWILMLGITSNAFQILLSKAFSKADLGALLPFDFSRLIFASIIGFIFFSEIPSFNTYIGALVIIASVIYLTYVETRLKRAANASINSL